MKRFILVKIISMPKIQTKRNKVKKEQLILINNRLFKQKKVNHWLTFFEVF